MSNIRCREGIKLTVLMIIKDKGVYNNRILFRFNSSSKV
jgi:hypothetical protein